MSLGKGMCRGARWSDGIWPVEEGRKTQKQCAEACAGTKGCLAFDLTHEQKGMFDCLLYGHNPVRPAVQTKGECFSLKDRVDDALENNDEDNDGLYDEEDEEDEIDPEDGTPEKFGKRQFTAKNGMSCNPISYFRRRQG